MKKVILLLTLFLCAGLSAQKGKGIFSRWNDNGDLGMNPGAADLILDSDGKPATAISLANTIELVGFLNEYPRRFPAENPDSFRGSVRFDNDGILNYKLAMPIEKLPVRNSRDGVGAMPVVLGIEYFTAALSSDNQENRSQAEVPSGRPGGGAQGGGRSGSSSTGGHGQGNFNSRSNSNSNQNNAPYVLSWIRNIKLATDK